MWSSRTLQAVSGTPLTTWAKSLSKISASVDILFISGMGRSKKAPQGAFLLAI
jgi:hypothetical protein